MRSNLFFLFFQSFLQRRYTFSQRGYFFIDFLFITADSLVILIQSFDGLPQNRNLITLLIESFLQMIIFILSFFEIDFCQLCLFELLL